MQLNSRQLRHLSRNCCMNAEPTAKAFETTLLYSHLWLLLQVVAASFFFFTIPQHDYVVLSSLFLIVFRFATLMIVVNLIVAAMLPWTVVPQLIPLL